MEVSDDYSTLQWLLQLKYWRGSIFEKEFFGPSSTIAAFLALESLRAMRVCIWPLSVSGFWGASTTIFPYGSISRSLFSNTQSLVDVWISVDRNVWLVSPRLRQRGVSHFRIAQE